MKKTLFVLAIFTIFMVVGCGSEQKSTPASKTPEAKSAVKVEEQQKVEYNEKGEKVYKMGNKSKLGDYIGKKSTEKSLHQFKTDHK